MVTHLRVSESNPDGDLGGVFACGCVVDSQREYQAAHGDTLACELVEPRW